MKLLSKHVAGMIPALLPSLVALMLLSISLGPAKAVLYSTLHSFDTATTGTDPIGNLLLASDGNFYGETYSGGSNNDGTIFKMTPAGDVTTLHSLTNNTDGYNPSGYIIQGTDGNLYGTTRYGDTGGGGIIWKLTLPGDVYSVVYNFSTAGGAPYYPYSGVVEDSSGYLYGTLVYGGANGYGAIYKVKASTGSYTDLYDFTSTDYYGYSYTPLVLDGTTLYDATYAGGANHVGSIFSITTSGGSPTTIYSFTSAGGNLGYTPYGLSLGADGKLYGVCIYGGSSGDGVVYSMATSATSPTVIHTFLNGTDGYNPVGPLIQDGSGNLYGMTQNGGTDVNSQRGYGVVFKMNTTGSSFTPLATQLNSGDDGYQVAGNVAFGPSSTLVGLDTYQAGTYQNYGAVFETKTTGAAPTLLHSFYSDGLFDGEDPEYGSIVYAPDGYYYGTTYYSQYVWNGTIFRFNPTGTYNIAHYFDANYQSDLDGANPYGTPIVGFDGDLIGLTSGGSEYGQGMVYDFDETTDTQTVLTVLGYPAGYDSYSNILAGSDGNYYATTYEGGRYNDGAIIEIEPDGFESPVYSFKNATDGYGPYGNIVESGGTIYGTCQHGGANNYGELWSWNATAGLTPLFSFNYSANGGIPMGVILGADGKLYGALNESSSGGGMLYSIPKSGSPFVNVHTFASASDGSSPQNAPFQGSTGKLYGTCYSGGTNGYGTVWQVTTTGGSFTLLHTFANNGTDGYYPYAAPMEGQDGNLYGTTYQGGALPYPGTNVSGTIYSVATALTVIDSMVDSVTGGPSGLGGDTVTINGANFTGATSVKFNGVTASFTLVNSNQITATVPNTATTGSVTVSATAGTATSSVVFTILKPTITALSETSGLVGDTETVTGTNFVNVLSVELNGGAITGYTVNSPTSISFTIPANGSSGFVKVTTEGGTATSVKMFTYKKPTVTHFTPTSGPVGTPVTITGTNYAGVSSVTFNGTASTSVTVNSTTSITATVPTGATTGKVAVTTPGGTGTSTANFTVN